MAMSARSNCAFSSAAALRRVFVHNVISAEESRHLQRVLLPGLALLQHSRSFGDTPGSRIPLRPLRNPPPRHPSRPSPSFPISRGPPVGGSRDTDARDARDDQSGDGGGDYGRPKIQVKLPPDGQIRNHGIKYQYIQIPMEEGGLGPPESTKAVLSRIDLTTHSLVLMAAPATDGSGPKYPVCRIVDNRAEYAKAKDKKKQEKKKTITKELEINWAIASHDLQTRMRQFKTFLGKGYRVEVLLMSKRKRDHRQASEEEAKAVLAAVREAFTEAPGATEVKPAEGQIGKQYRLYFQGAAAAPVAGAA